jgi:hypothetical protein
VTPEHKTPASGEAVAEGVDVSRRDGDVPAGNLFATPKLTPVDPADAKERRDAERLLESLEQG